MSHSVELQNLSTSILQVNAHFPDSTIPSASIHSSCDLSYPFQRTNTSFLPFLVRVNLFNFCCVLIKNSSSENIVKIHAPFLWLISRSQINCVGDFIDTNNWVCLGTPNSLIGMLFV
eukprot:Lithocolla_globosa_v1_NODE_1583_length_2467_cov_15.565506.p2 type:complete len:117 gc:universal NODE_1583_length_2467_cov_15.565506:1809-2159(+)